MLLALHLSDGFLSTPWLIAGFAMAAVLMIPAGRNVADREIPYMGLLTALYFVATLIHVRIGPSSVHLLFNGLVGVLVGRRAAIVIPVGLMLQAFLLMHGGITTLGVNAVVMTVPALLAGFLYRRTTAFVPSISHPLLAGAIAALAVLATLGLQALVLILGGNEDWSRLAVVLFTAHVPIILVEGIVTAIVVGYLERVRPQLLPQPSA